MHIQTRSKVEPRKVNQRTTEQRQLFRTVISSVIFERHCGSEAGSSSYFESARGSEAGSSGHFERHCGSMQWYMYVSFYIFSIHTCVTSQACILKLAQAADSRRRCPRPFLQMAPRVALALSGVLVLMIVKKYDIVGRVAHLP